MRNYKRTSTYLTALAVAVALGGCETLTVPDFNNPGVDELLDNPTRSAVVTATQGLMIGARRGIGEFNRYVSALGVLGRESYIFDPSDPRFISELLVGPLDPAGASFGGGGHWADRYVNIRNANQVLDAVDAAGSAFTDEEKEAIRGFAKTLQAHDFLLVINTRDDLGAPIAVGGDATGTPAPIVTKTEVFNHIVTLLDEAQTHLQSGGSSFPFSLSSGFKGFGTPGMFLRFNRALKARVDVYMGNFGTALMSLGGSFIDTSTATKEALDVGVYHAYSTAPGDIPNGLFDPSRLILLAHPSVVTDVQAGDDRLARKVVQVASVRDQTNLTDPEVSSDRAFNIYDRLSAPIPFIRNEELILLRAEANLMTGGAAIDDALADINFIRRVSGELADIPLATWQAMTATQQLDELLYNRRYSLLFEGHRWIDMRRHGRLMDLPLDHPTFVRFSRYPFPVEECDARVPAPSQGCSQDTGF